jgi:hypothetical protein
MVRSVLIEKKMGAEIMGMSRRWSPAVAGIAATYLLLLGLVVVVLLDLVLCEAAAEIESKNSTVTDSEIYIVVIEGDPVVNYNGSLPGLVATAEFYSHAWRAHHHR